MRNIIRLIDNTMKSNMVSRSDAIEFLKSLPDDSVDLFFTDPAYESLEKHRKGNHRLIDWFDIFPNGRFQELLNEMYRVLKNNRHSYIMCDNETMFIIKPMIETAGFKFWKPLIWDKLRIGMGYHYRGRYEVIMFFEKGKRKLCDLSIADVLPAMRVSGGYPTEKPEFLISRIITNSTYEYEIVCDPFCGSGSTAAATIDNNRIFYGSDISARAVKLTSNRILSSMESAQEKNNELTMQRLALKKK